MAVDVSPLSSIGVPLLGQWDKVRTVFSVLAPSTITLGTEAAGAYGRNRIELGRTGAMAPATPVLAPAPGGVPRRDLVAAFYLQVRAPTKRLTKPPDST